MRQVINLIDGEMIMVKTSVGDVTVISDRNRLIITTFIDNKVNLFTLQGDDNVHKTAPDGGENSGSDEPEKPDGSNQQPEQDSS